MTDNMSLQIAKGVYRNLGADCDALVKFNSGTYRSTGDPHGAANPAPEGRYLSDLFYGTETLSSEEAARLDTDPYALLVSNGQAQSPYDYYWGGYNTITGGRSGIDGADGWYFFGPDAELSGLKATVESLGLNGGLTTALTTKLDQVLQLLGRGQRAEALDVLGGAFVGQVNDLSEGGRLSDEQAAMLTDAAQQVVLHINMSA